MGGPRVFLGGPKVVPGVWEGLSWGVLAGGYRGSEDFW